MQLTSFRRRLALIAAFGLLLGIGMALILIGTARSAGQVVVAAKASHLRTQNFSALQFTADAYQRGTYEMLRWPSEVHERDRLAARQNLIHAIAAVSRLPSRDAREREADAHILVLAHQTQTMIERLPFIVTQVNQRWQENGGTAAMQEIQQRSLPYFQLVDALKREIDVNDVALRAATDRANRLQQVVIPAALVALLLALLSTVVVFLLIVGRLSPALRRLEGGVQKFANGEIDHRIELTGNDEFARLARSFNGMAGQIEEQQRHLRGAAADLELAVEKRTADLEQAHAELAAADHRRRAFFAEVSHELRTPITVIQGEAQVALRQAEHGTGDPAGSLERILGQSREVGRLINDLFLIARAEADGLDLHQTTVDAGELVGRVGEDFQAIASDCGVTIRTAAQPDLLVWADRGRLRQVLGAALDNAIRHGGPNVAVEIDARRKEDDIELRVRDNGPGVDPAMLDTLLQRFRRGSSTAEGSGLGLTIIRALVEAHRGRVRLSNRSTGGLEVIISLPAEKTRPQHGRDNDGEPASGGGRTTSR